MLLEENRQRREWRCCRIEVVLQQLGHGQRRVDNLAEIRVAQCDTLGKVIGDESVFLFSQDSIKFANWSNGFRRWIQTLFFQSVKNTEAFPILCRT